MNYKVRVQRLAGVDLRDAYEWARQHAPHTANEWLDRFQEAIASLEKFPERCPVAAESRKADIELRVLLFGRRPSVFRVIFHIDGAVVRVLRIRRAQRRFLTRGQIAEATRPDDNPELG